jgi:DNA-binding IscR family transcriptional regulator
MRYDTQILRAMLRLARRRQAADLEALSARVEASPAELRDALRRLEAQGLVARGGAAGEGRLTMTGLAVAVATVARAAGQRKPGRRPARVRAA